MPRRKRSIEITQNEKAIKSKKETVGVFFYACFVVNVELFEVKGVLFGVHIVASLLRVMHGGLLNVYQLFRTTAKVEKKSVSATL